MKMKKVGTETRGRKAVYSGVVLETKSVRLSPAQIEKFKALGGNKWLRKMIDEAKL